MPEHIAIARFWAKCVVNPFTGCLTWSAAHDATGYSAFKVDGRKVSAHRWIWQVLEGPIPPGLQLDHLCRNRACVNPLHLEPVTQLENVQRGEVGERSRTTTHCPRGHKYTPENTRFRKEHGRECRKCRTDRKRRRRNRDRQNSEVAAPS